MDAFSCMTKEKAEDAILFKPNTSGNCSLSEDLFSCGIQPTELEQNFRKIFLLHCCIGKQDCFIKIKRTILYMTNLIHKINKALKREGEFKKTLQASKSLNANCTRENSSIFRIPKLRKFYVDLQSCMKLETSAKSNGYVSNFAKLYMRLSYLRSQMLLYLKWLIKSRLGNLGYLSVILCGEGKYHLNDIFSTAECKRFSKLIYVYNLYSSKHVNDEIVTMIGKLDKHLTLGIQSRIRTSLTTASVDLALRGISEDSRSVLFSTVHPFEVNYLLHTLSKQFGSDVGLKTTMLLSCCVSQLRTDYSDIPKKHKLWGIASKIEIRPVENKSQKGSFFRVIKRVAGIAVPGSKVADGVCNELWRCLDKEEMMVLSFISVLAGKTNMLHQSQNIQDSVMSDDEVSVVSDESKVSFSSQLSDVKSVSWKDSWSHVIMKSITTKHSEAFQNSLPGYFSESQCTQMGQRFKSLIFSTRSEMDFILLYAIVGNLMELNVVNDASRLALLSTSAKLVSDVALKYSEALSCEMYGKMGTAFDKPNFQLVENGATPHLVTTLCISSMQPLLYLMEVNSHDVIMAKAVLPVVEAILNSGYGWIKRKIQEFFLTMKITHILKVCLCDLHELTDVALDSLRLVESCHDHVEKRRNQDLATLVLGTKHLCNIDSLITNMQMTSVSAISQFSHVISTLASKIIETEFPLKKFWVRKNSINTEQENKYVRTIISSLLEPSCEMLSDLNTQKQLAGMTPIMNSIFDALLENIAMCRFKFTVHGAAQLSYDFDCLINYVTDDVSKLTSEARTSLSHLHLVHRARHIVKLLQSVYYGSSENNLYAEASSGSMQESLDVAAVELGDEFWLSLRKDAIRKNKSFASLLPCMDKAV